MSKYLTIDKLIKMPLIELMILKYEYDNLLRAIDTVIQECHINKNPDAKQSLNESLVEVITTPSNRHTIIERPKVTKKSTGKKRGRKPGKSKMPAVVEVPVNNQV